jgi:hypothetical protein
VSNDCPAEEAKRVSRPFPVSYAEHERALINVAIAEASAEPRALVSTAGVCHHAGTAHYAVFGPLAYTLQCELACNTDGWAWETIPALSDQHAVGCWPHREAGAILHLTRFVWIEGAFVVGPRWEPVWISCTWQDRAEVVLGNSPQAAHAA